MLKETEFKIEDFSKTLADIDITHSGLWVGVTNFEDAEQSVYFDKNQIKLPEKIRFPIIRSIDDDTVLVANSRAWTKNNSWIIKSSGEAILNFPIGDAIENIVITGDFIVATYFDEAACYGEGLEVYDFEGQKLFGYGEIFGKDAVSISDCYAASLIQKSQIIFCPYTEFPIVIFDIETKTQKVWETPSETHGSHALTVLNDTVYFHRRYRNGNDFSIYEWTIGSKKARKIGEYENYFVRGLPNGRFLAKDNSGYTIISLQ